MLVTDEFLPRALHCIPSQSTMASMMRPAASTALSTARRKAATSRLASLERHFSTSQAMAFEVKKLGVVGSGQMVRSIDGDKTPP